MRLGLVGMAVLGLVGTGSAQSVTYDYAKGTDFSRLKTYTWIPGTSVKDELNHKRIIDAVDAQLAAKGLTKAAAGQSPDLQVTYHANFDRQLQVNAWSSGMGGGWRMPSDRWGSARTQEILEGTLVVELTDAATKSTLWRGTASREIDTKASPEKRDKSVTRAAEKLFKNYPPKE